MNVFRLFKFQRFNVILKVKRKKAKEIDLGGRSLIKKKTDLFYTCNNSYRDCSLDVSRKIKNE